MEESICEQVEDEAICKEFKVFLDAQDFDTECIEDEMATFEEEKTCNLYTVLRGREDGMNVIRSILRHHRILSKTFATGYHFLYWKWYRTATVEQMRGSWLLSWWDLGGCSFQDLSVHRRFDSLKAEVLASGLVTPETFHKLVIQKAKEYLNTKKCRKMRSDPFSGELGNDPLHFGIKRGSPLSLHHLCAIILYTDFTELCTLFSLSMRKNKFGDGLHEIKARNSGFFHFSKFLRELVTYFGSYGEYGNTNGRVSGLFFSGVSTVLNVNAFSIGFNTPTSTSMSIEIAWRFAGVEGMVLALKNEGT